MDKPRRGSPTKEPTAVQSPADTAKSNVPRRFIISRQTPSTMMRLKSSRNVLGRKNVDGSGAGLDGKKGKVLPRGEGINPHKRIQIAVALVPCIFLLVHFSSVLPIPALPRPDNSITSLHCTVDPSIAPAKVDVAGSSYEHKSFNYNAIPGTALRVQYNSVFSARALDVTKGQKPLVTIVTCTNNPVHLDETAKAIFSQSFQQFRWIIVNDHTDNPDSLELLHRYRKIDTRVQVIDCQTPDNSPCYVSKSRNLGLALVETEFVVPLDDDDILEHTYLEKMVWFLVSNEEFAYVNSFLVGFMAKNYLWDRTFHLSSLQENQNCITGMIRMSALRNVTKQWPRAYDEAITMGAADWKLWLQLKAGDQHGSTVPEFLFWYREKPKRRDWILEGERAYGPKIAQEEFPKLYEVGHRNPKVNDCQDEKDFEDCYRDSHLPVQFSNVRWTNPLCKPLQKHILLVIPWMALGGADVVNVKVVRALAEQNWKITIVLTMSTSESNSATSDPDFLRPVVQQYTEDIFTLPHFVRIEDYGRFFLYLLESRVIDVVLMSHSFAGYNLLPFLKTHASKEVVFADFVHMVEAEWKAPAFFEKAEDVQGGGYSRLSAQFAKFLDVSLFGSDDVRQSYPRPKENKAHVVYSGLEPAMFRQVKEARWQLRSDNGIGEETMCILFLGRLVDQKRPLVMLRIFERVLTQLKNNNKADAHLFIAGDGILVDDVRGFIANAGLDKHVTMLGSLTRDEVLPVLSASDVFFLPSQMEGLSVALIEAMAAGLVPVATDVGGQKEIVKPGAGWLFHPEDELGMTKALFELAVNSEKREAMSKMAQQIVEEDFSFSKMKERLELYLGDAMEIKKRPHLRQDEEKGLKLAASSQLPRALHHIRTHGGPSLAATLNVYNLPPRETVLGLKLSLACGEDASHFSAWTTLMEKATMCDSSEDVATVMDRLLEKQCGQWCVFSLDDPDNIVWEFNGNCFTSVTTKDHWCHRWTDLKEKLKSEA